MREVRLCAGEGGRVDEAVSVLEVKRSIDTEVARLAVESARLRAVEADFDRAEAAFAREQEEFRRRQGGAAAQLPARVKLNVGGEYFFATASGLRSQRGLLRAVCDGVGNVGLDEEGCIFIDRSPLAFRFVLNHLAGEPLRANAMTPLEKEVLLADAEFMGCTAL